MGTLEERECLHRARASCLENIRTLNVWGSNLHDISIVQKMINIEVLNLSVNNITSLSDLAFCPRLKEIYLRKNHISKISELRYLKNLPNLQVLWLSDNPCTEENNYRETVLKNLPKLKKLDSNLVTEDDLAKAKDDGIIITGEEELPLYDGLDLDKSLTVDMLKKHLERLPVTEEKRELPDEKSVTLSSSNVIEKQILGDEPTQENSNTKHVTENELDNSRTFVKENLNGSASGHSNSSSLVPARSNTLSAVLLLLEDMNEQELLEVKHQVDLHLSNKVEVVPISESLLVD